MPPKKLIECAIIILDCSVNVSERIKYFYKITSTKYFNKSRDVNKILFFNNGGSCTTEIMRDWSEYDLANLEAIRDEVVELESTFSPMHLASSLQVALNCFEEDEDSVKNNFKRVVLISDFKNATDRCDTGKLDDVLDKVQVKLAKSNVWLYIMGPSVKTPKLYTKDDVAQFSKNIEPADHLEDNSKFVIKKFSKLFQKNNHGVMCDYETGFHLLFSFVPKLLTSYPYYVDLSLGSSIRIPVLVTRLTRDAAKVKQSLCFTDLQCNTDKAWFEKKSHERVLQDDVASGFEFHKKRVILTPEEEASLRDDTSLKCLSIVAFVSADEIHKELYFISHNLNIIVPDPRKGDGCERDLCAFLNALRRKNVIAIAKRVYNNKFRPWTFAVFACPEHERCLLMGKLPFKHEFNERYVAGRPIKLEHNDEKSKESLYEFLDGMEAKDGDFCDDGKTIHPLAEILRQNPNRSFKYEYLGLKSVNVSMEKTRELLPHPILTDRSKEPAEFLLQSYADDEEDK